MCRGERKQPYSSPKVARQVAVMGMWVSQDGNLSIGSSSESTSSPNLCNLLLDGGQRGLEGIHLSVAPYFGYKTEGIHVDRLYFDVQKAFADDPGYLG
ncbi:hypothetical protein TURU_099844 [Turdus rufiventris]|nr:hypothetical protein TURU_099844 [Turdus rufiventris]